MKVKPGIALLLLPVPVLLLLASNSYLATANPRPHPTHGCSAKTTVGRYVVICNGFLSPGPNAPLLPAKLLATTVSDDQGNINGSGTIMIGGGPKISQTVSGTEDLNSDCTGNITYQTTLNGRQGPPLNITFVVSEDGDRIDGLVVDPGTVFSCELRRTSKGD